MFTLRLRPQGGRGSKFWFSSFSDMLNARQRSFRCKKPDRKILFLGWVNACWSLGLTCNYIANLNLKWKFYRLLEVNLNQAETLYTCLVGPILKTLYLGIFLKIKFVAFMRLKRANFCQKWHLSVVLTSKQPQIWITEKFPNNVFDQVS